MKVMILMMKDPRTTADPIKPDADLLRLFLPSPFIRKPNKGNVGMSQTRLKVLFINILF
jgi:hypothetical protein